MIYQKVSGKQMFKMFFKLLSHENHKIVKKPQTNKEKPHNL